MTTLLHQTPYTPVAFTASSEAAGYPASNVGNLRVLKPWRSTATGSQWLQVDLGAGFSSVRAVALSDVNISAANLLDGVSNPPTNVRGALVPAADHNGRYKVSFAGLFTTRHLRIDITGSVTDGMPYFRIGSILVFSVSPPLPRDALYGSTNIDVVYPQSRVDLPNGATEVNSTGPSYCEIALGFAGRASDDMEALARAARADVCWLDLGLPDRGQQWPVRHADPRVSRRLEKFNRETQTITVREVA